MLVQKGDAEGLDTALKQLSRAVFHDACEWRVTDCVRVLLDHGVCMNRIRETRLVGRR